MPYRTPPHRFLCALLAIVLGAVVATPSHAENLRVLEVSADGLPLTRPAEAQVPRDGLDPVTYHVLFETPTDAKTLQVLWESQSEPIVIDNTRPEAIDEYPMALHARLPQDGDLMYQAWSVTEQRLLREFTHFAHGPDWGVSQGRLAALPAGEYTLVMSIRRGGKPLAQASQRIDVRQPGTDLPDYRPTTPDRPTYETGGPWIDRLALEEREPSDDSRIIYVSSSTGNDRNDGLTPQTAVRTPRRGYALLRHGSPDWLLFRRGDTFHGGLADWGKSGRSVTEPMVVGAYGDADAPRPRFHTDNKGLLSPAGKDTIAYVVFSDLHGYANHRDPDSPDFTGGRTREFGIRWWVKSHDIMFENLLLEYYAFNMDISGHDAPDDLQRMTVSRCVLRNAYSPHDLGHSQGMGTGRVAGMRIIDCIFDHNGWNEDVPKANRTGFNQNLYVYQVQDLVVEGCVFARGSNLGLKLRSDIAGGMQNAVVHGNLFVDNLTGMSVGGDPIDGDPDAYTHLNLTVTGNVFTHNGGPVNRETILGIGLSLKQIDGALVEGNLFVDKVADTNWYAIEVSSGEPHRNIAVQGNIVHRWPAGEPLINGGVVDQLLSTVGNLVELPDAAYFDASRSIERYVTGQLGLGSLDDYYDAVGRPTGVDPAGPLGGAAIVDYLQQGFAR